MTLLLTVFAGIAATVVWYCSERARRMKAGMLCYLFWGASLMWLVDAVVEYLELGPAYFTPSVEDMINDAFLGLAVIALALVIWVVTLLISDPCGVVKKALWREAAAEKTEEQV